MLVRPKYPRKCNTVVVTDYPVVNDLNNETAYSSASGLTLMGDLHRQGIKQRTTFYTYLSYTRPDSDSYDWCKDFAKRSVLEPLSAPYRTIIAAVSEPWHTTTLGIGGIPYFAIPHQKDLYMSLSLFKEFLGLLENIREAEPTLIILTGKWSLFLLTAAPAYVQTQGTSKDAKALGGINKYRASILNLDKSFNLPDTVVIPLLPVTAKFKMPDKIPIMNWDYTKVGSIFKRLSEGEKPSFFVHHPTDFHYGLDFKNTLNQLLEIYNVIVNRPTYTSIDIETRHNTIDCIGIGIQLDKAVCLPLSTLSDPLAWSEDEEVKLTWLFRKIMLHPNCLIVGQNFSYDAQYIYRDWLITVEATIDTMILHHCMYNYMPKALDFLASVYCEHYKYWKDMQSHGK